MFMLGSREFLRDICQLNRMARMEQGARLKRKKRPPQDFHQQVTLSTGEGSIEPMLLTLGIALYCM